MKCIMAIFVAGFALSCGAQTLQRYEDYETFYMAQSRRLFEEPIEWSDRNALYVETDKEGVFNEGAVKWMGRKYDFRLYGNHFRLRGKRYLLRDAKAFKNEFPSDIDPSTAEAFVGGASASKNALCVEGYSNGSGEKASRHVQVYLLLVSPQGQETFLHLPSLLSSCRAIVLSEDGEILFPSNSYLPEGWFLHEDGKRTGLLLSYFTYKKNRFIKTDRRIELKFETEEVPFVFSVQSAE